MDILINNPEPSPADQWIVGAVLVTFVEALSQEAGTGSSLGWDIVIDC